MIRSMTCDVKAPAPAAPQADRGITSSELPLIAPATPPAPAIVVVVACDVVVDDWSVVVVAADVVVVASIDVDVVPAGASAVEGDEAGIEDEPERPGAATTSASSGRRASHTPAAPNAPARITRNRRRPTEFMPVP